MIIIAKSLLWLTPCFLVSFIFHWKVILPLLRRLKFYQVISEDAPQRHKLKAGIPTAGGLGIAIITAVLISVSLIWYNKADFSFSIWAPFLILIYAIISFAALGFLDDYLKVSRRQNLGLKARHKLLAQIILASPIVLYTGGWYGGGLHSHSILSGLPIIFLKLLFIVWLINCVNLTDGLDGLCVGLSSIAFIFLSLIPVLYYYLPVSLLKDVKIESVINIPPLILLGACLGFLPFNLYPAKVFLGDTGSMALGAALATESLAMGNELIMLLICGVFVIEGLSVALQVVYFKLTGGRRIFKMAPLHHHFELLGWSEPKIVKVFWVAGGCLGIISSCFYLVA